MSEIVEFYFSMVEVASPIIREYDPTAKIILIGGLNLWSGKGPHLELDMKFAQELMALNIEHYGDAISIHAYPWMGASITTLLAADARALDFKTQKGALVVEIVRGGPAHKAGLRGGNRRVRLGNRIVIIGGDVVVAADGRPIDTADTLIGIIREKRPGDLLRLEVYRGGLDRQELLLQLEERPRRR